MGGVATTGWYLIFSASNSLWPGLLNFFLLANQSFYRQTDGVKRAPAPSAVHVGPTRLILALIRSRSIRGIIFREMVFWLGST